jgi:hypothetical protein
MKRDFNFVNGRAAWLLMKTLGHEPGLDYRTYRKCVSRLPVQQVKPILVQKFDSSRMAVTYTQLGTQWLREKHSLGTVTGNGKKMSHDTETLTRFNAVNGCGKITVKRARTRRVRSGQHTPANNSPDLHPAARAGIALSLDRL